MDSHSNTLYVSGICPRVNPCPNGAYCVDGEEGYRCVVDDCSDAPCPSGYIGSKCTEVDDCAGNPCGVGGICTDGNRTFTCNCSENYGGATCKLSMDFSFIETFL